jgi:aerobic-type carbon monoxide dehydrogenase small subunit (CoxS/CutS family)
VSTHVNHPAAAIDGSQALRLRVNGAERVVSTEAETLLVDLLRDGLGLKGTHVGCLSGDCGACTVSLDGLIVRSCTVLAATLDGAELVTIEGLGAPGALHPVQQAFWDSNGFQCGFCLPGMLFATLELLAERPQPEEAEIRQSLSGTLCRCTGYQSQVAAVRTVARAIAGTP